MNKLLLDKTERLIEHLQKELLEIKLERDKFQQLLEKPRVEQLQWAKSKAVSRECIYTCSACATIRIPPTASFARITPQPAQFENLYMRSTLIAVNLIRVL